MHYSTYTFIPVYVKIFINELSKYYDEIIISTNRRIIHCERNLSEKVRIVFTENDGYDFGRFYSILKQIIPEDYQRISFINDSNILIKSLTNVFQWAEKEDADFWGLIESYERPPNFGGKDSYHLQSHFLTFEKKAIPLLMIFFNDIDFKELIKKQNSVSSLRNTIINYCEIGLSQFFIEKGLNILPFINIEELSQKYKIEEIKSKNPTLFCFNELLKSNYPLIKRNITNGQMRFYERSNQDSGFNKWVRLSLRHTDKISSTFLIIVENKIMLAYKKSRFKFYKIVLLFINSLIPIKNTN